jgi:ketosteroid isomerase-like protein
MRKLLFFSVIFLLAFISVVCAQGKKERAVAIAVEHLRKAMVDGDKTELEKSVSDKLSYGHSGGHVEGKAEFVEKIVTGKSDFVIIDLTEQTISISGKVAVVRHILTAKTNDNGKPADVKLKVLTVWQRQKGGWKLLARQAVHI